MICYTIIEAWKRGIGSALTEFVKKKKIQKKIFRQVGTDERNEVKLRHEFKLKNLVKISFLICRLKLLKITDNKTTEVDIA